MDPVIVGEDRRIVAPASDRNKQPILNRLLEIFPADAATDGRVQVLEVGSGSGQHAAHFAQGMPHVQFMPTDIAEDTFDSIAAWCAGLENVAAPRVLDCSSLDAWSTVPEGSCDGIFAANVCHISPFSATSGLLAGASRALRPGGRLCIYGPFTTDSGKHTSDGNSKFDCSLRERNANWGYRDVDTDMKPLAAELGLDLTSRFDMPANNFLLVFLRPG